MMEIPQENDDEQKAILFGCQITNDDKVKGTWFLNLVDSESDAPHANISAILVEKAKDQTYVLAWRIRIIVDNDMTSSSRDQKMFARNTCSTEGMTPEQAYEKAKAVVEQWGQIWNAEVHYHDFGWAGPKELFKGLKENAPKWMKMSEPITGDDAKEAMEKLERRNKYRI